MGRASLLLNHVSAKVFLGGQGIVGEQRSVKFEGTFSPPRAKGFR